MINMAEKDSARVEQTVGTHEKGNNATFGNGSQKVDTIYSSDIFDRLFKCVSQTWYGCIFEKTLLVSNLLSWILLCYLVIIVYWWQR